MKQDLAITWASGKDFIFSPFFKVYLDSLVNFPGEKVILTCDNFSIDGIKVIKCNPKKSIFIERHFFFWDYLIKNKGKYRYIIHTDCKDVIFQKNFIPYLEENYKNKFVLLVSEGMRHNQSPWNAMEQMKCQQNCPGQEIDFRNWQVLNGGVQIGTSDELANLFFLLWSNGCRTQNCTDQGVLNYLYHFLQRDSIYSFVNPLTSPLVVTGEAIKEGYVKIKFENNKFLMDNGEEYFIVHQWDRVFKKEILDTLK